MANQINQYAFSDLSGPYKARMLISREETGIYTLLVLLAKSENKLVMRFQYEQILPKSIFSFKLYPPELS